jgi:hypothetical protein
MTEGLLYFLRAGDEAEKLYTRDVIERIANAAGIRDTSNLNQLHPALKHWAASYLSTRRAAARPPAKKAKASLRRIEKLSTDLRSAILQLDDDTRSLLVHVVRLVESHRYPHQFGQLTQPEEKRLQFTEQEIGIARVLARGAHNLLSERKSGRQPNVARRMAVMELGHVFCHFTGDAPTRRSRFDYSIAEQQGYGPFHDFVIAALTPIEGQAAEVGVDRLVRETIKNMDKTSPPWWLLMAIGRDPD